MTPLPEWLQRLIAERDQCEERLNKLEDYLEDCFDDSPLVNSDLSLMHKQSNIMREYLNVLNHRIRRAMHNLEKESASE